MSDKKSASGWFYLVIAVFIIGLFFWAIFTAEGKGYEEGQIDALSGNVKYCKVVQSDGSVQWELIKEGTKCLEQDSLTDQSKPTPERIGE